MKSEVISSSGEGLEEKGFHKVLDIERLIEVLPKHMRSSFTVLLAEREDQGVGTDAFVSSDGKLLVLMPKLGIEVEPMNTLMRSFEKPLNI